MCSMVMRLRNATNPWRHLGMAHDPLPSASKNLQRKLNLNTDVTLIVTVSGLRFSDLLGLPGMLPSLT